jgi:hypothetical protein
VILKIKIIELLEFAAEKHSKNFPTFSLEKQQNLSGKKHLGRFWFLDCSYFWGDI